MQEYRCLVGSDSLDPFVFPGESLHRELAELVRAGLTPAEALQAATSGAATFLGREHDLGTVETGKMRRFGAAGRQSAREYREYAESERVSSAPASTWTAADLDKLLAQAKAAARRGRAVDEIILCMRRASVVVR